MHSWQTVARINDSAQIGFFLPISNCIHYRCVRQGLKHGGMLVLDAFGGTSTKSDTKETISTHGQAPSTITLSARCTQKHALHNHAQKNMSCCTPQSGKGEHSGRALIIHQSFTCFARYADNVNSNLNVCSHPNSTDDFHLGWNCTKHISWSWMLMVWLCFPNEVI